MLNDRDGDVALVLDLFQQVDGVVGIGPRHAGGRFVQQQDIRLARECFGKGRAALLSSRQGGWVCRAIDAEFHQLRFGHVAGL